mgnify:CR=1 FL=1
MELLYFNLYVIHVPMDFAFDNKDDSTTCMLILLGKLDSTRVIHLQT